MQDEWLGRQQRQEYQLWTKEKSLYAHGHTITVERMEEGGRSAKGDPGDLIFMKDGT